MSELIDAFGPTPDATEVAQAPRRASRPTVLITVQQLLFGSAASIAKHPRKQRSAGRDVPARYDYLEFARMGREMDRL
jgi:hypothetical protein